MDQAACTFRQSPAPRCFRVGDLNGRVDGEEFTYHRRPACRLLEVGSSSGAFVYLAQQAGFEVESSAQDKA